MNFNEQKGLNSSTNQHKCWCNTIYRLIIICNRIWGASWKSGWVNEWFWTHGASKREREKLYLLPKTACFLYELSRDDDELYITDIHFVFCNSVVVLYCWGKGKKYDWGEKRNCIAMRYLRCCWRLIQGRLSMRLFPRMIFYLSLSLPFSLEVLLKSFVNSLFRLRI